MFQRTLIHAALCSFLLTIGCGDEPVEQQDDDQQQEQQQEEQLDVYDPTDEDRETAIEFIVENATHDTPFFLQVSTEDEPEPAWLTLHAEGEELRLHPHCMPRLCDADKKPVCDELERTAIRVQADEAATYEWDAHHYVVTDDGCTRRVEVTDEEMEAQICWGMEGNYDEQTIDDIDCAGDEIAPPATSAGEVDITVD